MTPNYLVLVTDPDGQVSLDTTLRRTNSFLQCSSVIKIPSGMLMASLPRFHIVIS